MVKIGQKMVNVVFECPLTYTDLSPVVLKKAVVNEHFCQQIVKDRFKWYFYADDKFRRTHAFEHKEKL